jgi:hypothetical protein
MDVIAKFVHAIVNFLTTVLGAILDTIESTVGIILDALGFVVGLLEAIPVVGRIIGQLVSGAHFLIATVLSIPDFLLGLIGIRPEKKLRLMVIVQADENGSAVTSAAAVRPFVQYLIDTFYDQANVRVIPAKPFAYTSAFADKPTADDSYVTVLTEKSEPGTLDVRSDLDSWTADLGVTGAGFQWKMIRHNFFGNGRRLIGLGAPVCAFAVRKFHDNHTGSSLGPLTDYVMMDFAGQTQVLAHETGHACNLWHVSDPANLMIPHNPHGRELGNVQRALVRASRHVTYL